MVVDFHWIKTVFAVTAVLCFLQAALGKCGYFHLKILLNIFFNFSTPSALVGIIGACLEKASCVFLFAVFYLISIIVCNISAIVGYATWDFDEVVTTTVMDGDKERKVEVIWITAVWLQVWSLSSCSPTILTCQGGNSALQVYFAVCLFSFYYELKNKKEVERRDSEMATVNKNVS